MFPTTFFLNKVLEHLCVLVSMQVHPFRSAQEDIQTSCGTWPGSRTLPQPLDTLHQFLKAQEALVSTVGQDSLGVHEETRQAVGAEQQREGVLTEEIMGTSSP